MEICDLENVGQGHDVQHLQWLFNGKYTNSHIMAIVIFVLALTICEIFTKQEKCQNFDLIKNDGQGIEQQDLCHLTGNVRIHIFQNFSYLGTYVYAQTWIHTHK